MKQAVVANGFWRQCLNYMIFIYVCRIMQDHVITRHVLLEFLVRYATCTLY